MIAYLKYVLPVCFFSFVMLCLRADVESGPKPDAPAEEFKVFAYTEPKQFRVVEKELEIVKERGKLPTVYLFVNAEKLTRPVAQYLRKIDEEVDNVNPDAVAVIVWVHGDISQMKAFLQRAQMSLNFTKSALTAFEGDQPGPNGWSLNTDASLTAVVVNEGKIWKSFAYDTLNATDAEKLIAGWKKELAK